MNKSFQQRIFIGLTTLVLLISVLFGSGTLVIAYVTEDLLIARLLNEEAQEITRVWQQDGKLPQPTRDYLTIYPGEQTMPEWLRVEWHQSGPDNEVFAENEHYHIKAIDLSENNQPILVARVSELLVVTKLTEAIALFMALIALIAVSFAIALAWWLARVINAPLKELASDVTSNQLSGQKESNLPQEIAILRTKITDTIQALQLALQREQDFTRDVSHELRTPLTHLKNELLLLSQGQTPLIPHQSLNAMQKDITDLEQTLSILLAIAREENLNSQELRLKPAIESALLKLHQQTDLDTLDIRLDISESATIQTSPVLLSLILQNILLNAILHGDGKLHVYSEDNTLVFENPPGAPNRQSKGMGHGLKLISKLTDLMDANLQWQNQDKLFRVVIRFRQPV